MSPHPDVEHIEAAADRPLEPSVDGHGPEAVIPDPPWPVLAPEAYHGLLGEFVRCVEPYSEADPVAILLHTLVAAGSLIGSTPHMLVEHTPHPSRINLLLVGQTAGGRKGTAWSTPKHVLSRVDEAWSMKRVKSGLSSGEGLIFQVRDAQYEQRPIREGGRRTGDIVGYEEVMTDAGEPDKRLLVIESEFASTLKVMEREGNTLSPVIRDAWDHGTLSPLTKKDRLTATGAHISVIGHITKDELLRSLTATERANGFANRFLVALVRRSKYLPAGAGVPPAMLEPYITRFSRRIEQARTLGAFMRDREADALWAKIYEPLEQEVPGLTGAILARAAAQVLRVSLVYALLDDQPADRPVIRVPHLLAALAVWDYCKASTFAIFGDAIGDEVADRLLRAIKSGPQTDTDLYELLGKRDGGRKDRALDLLQRLNRVHPLKVPTDGRPITEWHVGSSTDCVLCVKRV